MCHGETGTLYTIDYNGTIYHIDCNRKEFTLKSTLPVKYVKVARYMEYIGKFNLLVISSFFDKRIRAVSAATGEQVWELVTELEVKPVGFASPGKQGLLLAGKILQPLSVISLIF